MSDNVLSGFSQLLKIPGEEKLIEQLIKNPNLDIFKSSNPNNSKSSLSDLFKGPHVNPLKSETSTNPSNSSSKTVTNGGSVTNGDPIINGSSGLGMDFSELIRKTMGVINNNNSEEIRANNQSITNLFKSPGTPTDSTFKFPTYGTKSSDSTETAYGIEPAESNDSDNIYVNNNQPIRNNVISVNPPKDNLISNLSFDKLIQHLQNNPLSSTKSSTIPTSSVVPTTPTTPTVPTTPVPVLNPFAQISQQFQQEQPQTQQIQQIQQTQQKPFSLLSVPTFTPSSTSSPFSQQSTTPTTPTTSTRLFSIPTITPSSTSIGPIPTAPTTSISQQTSTPSHMSSPLFSIPVVTPISPQLQSQQPQQSIATLPLFQSIPIPTDSKPLLTVPTSSISDTPASFMQERKHETVTVNASIRANDEKPAFKGEEDIIVHAYDWNEQDEYNPDGSSMTVNCWALGRNDEPYLLRINNMYISCFLELNAKVDGKLFRWDEYHIRKVGEYINKCMGTNKPEYIIPTYMKKLYYYRDNPNLGENGIAKYPMLALVFRNHEQLKHCKNLMTNKPRFINEIGTVTSNIWESDISSIRKMLTLRKMKYSQWFSTRGRLVPEHEKISKLKNEFYIDFKNINPIDPNESKSWVTHPRVFSVDIETYSDNKKALPNKTNPNHPAYLVTIVYQRTGLPETRQRYAIFMGEFFKELEKDYKVIKVNTEVELCDKMCELIGELDPEILIGWNIFGYDYPYLDARLQMRNEEWSNKASRIIKKKPFLKSSDWTSSGYGINEMNILLMEGRINIDEMMVVKRDYKLPRYNLDTAAWKFVKKHKNDMTAEQMFIFYEEMDTAIKLFNRIVEDYDDDGNPKFFDNVSQEVIDQVALKLQNAMDNMEKVVDYGIQDSNLPMDIFDKINTWIGLVQMSNIVGVTITEIFTRGQQIRGLSQLYDLAHDPKYNYVLDKKPASKIDWVGGFVNDPVAGLHEFVSCLDFKSLYPSIIIAFNICYTTFIPFELMDKIPDEMCNVIEWDEVPDENDDDDDDDEKENGALDEDGIRKKAPKQITHYKYKFIKKEYKEGLLPILVGNLISERRRVVRLANAEKDPVTKVVLDKTQWGLKISANSVFGMLGAETGKRPLVEAAMCITAMGRMLIEKANKILTEEFGMIILYNDTDSTFFKNPKTKTAMEAIKEAHELEKIISARYPDPLYFEHEKSGRVLLIKKKKYAFWHYDLKTGELKDPDKDDEAILMRGIVLARRDNCQYQRDFYYKILYGVLQRKSRQEIMDIILKEITRLYRHEVKWEDLTMIKGLGAHYKSDTYFMKVFSDELRRIGKPQPPGSRLDYLIVEDNRGETLLGKKMRLPETYLERKGTEEEEKIDVLYYIEKVVTNCIEQLWQIGFSDEIKELEPKHQYEDFMNILNILMNDEKKGGFCREVFHNCGGNPFSAYDIIHGTKGMKGKAEDAYRRLKGMHAFIPRLSLNPIKMLKKAILLNKYQETIKALASKELYKELYPEDKDEEKVNDIVFDFGNGGNNGGNNGGSGNSSGGSGGNDITFDFGNNNVNSNTEGNQGNNNPQTFTPQFTFGQTFDPNFTFG